MKNFFTKKTIKILTGAVFVIFVLIMFNFKTAEATTNITTKETGGGTLTTVTETTFENRKNAKTGFGAGYIVEREESNDYLNYKGDKSDEKNGETQIKEEYTDENNTVQSRSGSARYSDDGNTYEYWGDGEWGKLFKKQEDYVPDKSLTYTLLQPLPTNSGEDLKTNVTLKQYLTWAYKFALALTGFLAVMMIVIGGVEWIISGASESMRSEAKKHINGAITGLIMALVAYLVLYTINPSLVNFEDNWFFKPRDANSGTVNSGNGGKNILTNVYDKNENSGGTVKYTANSTYKKQDGEFSYDVKVTKEAISYQDGSNRYRTTEDYTDKNQNKHIVINTKDKYGNNVFSGERIDYGNNGGTKYYKNNQEVKQNEFYK